MSSYRVEEILRQAKNGDLSEYEAKRKLEREFGDCSCMHESIGEAVRKVQHGYDPWSMRRKLENDKDMCDLEDRRRSQEEGW